MRLIGELLNTVMGARGQNRQNHESAMLLSIYTRTDYNNKCFVTTKAGGPAWDQVVRRVTINLDNNKTIEDQAVKDTCVGYDWHAPLPNGVTNIKTQLYWEDVPPPPEPTMHGNVQRRVPQTSKRVVFNTCCDDCPSPLPTSGLGEDPLPTIPPFPTFTTSTTQTDDLEASTEAHPTEARIKQKEKLKAEKEAGIKPRKMPQIWKVAMMTAARTLRDSVAPRTSSRMLPTSILTPTATKKMPTYHCQQGYLLPRAPSCLPRSLPCVTAGTTRRIWWNYAGAWGASD